MWNERYQNNEYVYGENPNDFLAKHAEVLSHSSHVLSLGEGEGRNAVFLAGLGHSVVGIDLSDVGLKKAQQLASDKAVIIETQQADITQYDLGQGKWDAIISIFFHLPSELRADVHKRMQASLKPGGIIILEAYRPEQLNYKTGGPPSANMMLTKEELSLDFKDMELLLLEDVERYIEEGTGHVGQSATVQLIAKKRGR